jgi:hypothetical protein
MTLQKKLKKAIRARSQKTGESYTSARRQVLLGRDKKAQATGSPLAPEPPAVEPEPVPAPAAQPSQSAPPTTKGGGLSDEAARKKTGHGLDHWFAVLDAFGAATKGHTATAAHLYNDHGVPGWHSQGITVAYERARGLRDVNQSCAGDFQVSVSKTVPVPVSEVVDALKSAERRAVWLKGADPVLVQALAAAFTGPKPREVKTKGENYAWLRFPWGASKVVIYINGKPKGATVVADNTSLADGDHVEQRRAQWRVALDGLQRHLAG